MKINNLKSKELGVRKVEITGEIEADQVSIYFDKALKNTKENLTIDGFRKGGAPESVVLQKIGEMSILKDASQDLLNDTYPQIIKDLKIDPIGTPEIQITKIAKGNPLGFSIITHLSPIIELPDYKKIAKEKNAEKSEEIKVLQKEIDDVILNLRKNIAHEKIHQDEDIDGHNHPEIKEEDLPKVDLEFLKLFGDFKTEEEFRDKIKSNLALEKERKEKDRKRTSLLESVLTKTKIEMPEILVQGELDKMKAEFSSDLEKVGIKIEEYLKHINKNEEDLKKDWLATAEIRAKTQILLYEIAKKENIRPKEDEIKKEMDYILSEVKNAERFRVRMYVENFLTNDLTIKFLEEIKL